MAAALWDLLWDLDGRWHAQLAHVDQAGTAILPTGPCVLEVRNVDQSTDEPALLSVSGTPIDEGAAFDLIVTREQINDLGRGRYEHRVFYGEDLLARGYVVVRDTVGD